MERPEPLRTLYWESGMLYLLDQRLLPGEIRYVSCGSAGAVAEAIKGMAVRGAPAIGVAAAFGMVLAAREAVSAGSSGTPLPEKLEKAAAVLLRSRPTAVNLAWALERMRRRINESAGAGAIELAAALEREARAIMAEDEAANRLIGSYGAALLPARAAVLTHCNAGALATAGFGTALGVIRAAFERGKITRVFVDETRPLLQGARLTALELLREKIPATLVTDSCAAHLMARGKVDLVVVGADRIAANGDAANKIGTYGLAVLARHHRIPFYIAAPCSTIDLNIAAGSEIVIEERDPAEVTHLHGCPVAPEGIGAFNPAFDVTPAALITAIITERGVVQNPGPAGVAGLFKQNTFTEGK